MGKLKPHEPSAAFLKKYIQKWRRPLGHLRLSVNPVQQRPKQQTRQSIGWDNQRCYIHNPSSQLYQIKLFNRNINFQKLVWKEGAYPW